jgi:hypothetical protein
VLGIIVPDPTNLLRVCWIAKWQSKLLAEASTPFYLSIIPEKLYKLLDSVQKLNRGQVYGSQGHLLIGSLDSSTRKTSEPVQKVAQVNLAPEVGLHILRVLVCSLRF